MRLAAKILLGICSDERGRKVVAAIAVLLVALMAGFFLAVPLLITSIVASTVFMTDNPEEIASLAAAMDAARADYIDEQVTNGYFAGLDPNGSPYRNKVFQWQDGFSNNDKEIISMAACYYLQEWDRDFSALCELAALRSISFTQFVGGPYYCTGCATRYVCDGHTTVIRLPNGRTSQVTTYHTSPMAAPCENSHAETYCPGNHYDLYVTGTILGWDHRGEDGSVNRFYASQWDALTSTARGSSEVMNARIDRFLDQGGNPTWTGWGEEETQWSINLCLADWEELYGVAIVQTGATGPVSTYVLTEADRAYIQSGALAMPITDYTYISCWYGDPDGMTGAPHGGMDFAAAAGTPILAAADGVVVAAGWHNSYGNYVKIYNGVVDGKELYTLYAHACALYISAGQQVSQGTQIAAVGSTGDSTGNHLHFEVQLDSVRTDPAPWIGFVH